MAQTDQTSDTRARDSGSAEDRKPQPFKNLAQRGGAYGLASLAVPTIHWLAKCFAAGHGHFQYVPPDDTLQDVWYIAAIPTLDALTVVWNRFLGKITGQEKNA